MRSPTDLHMEWGDRIHFALLHLDDRPFVSITIDSGDGDGQRAHLLFNPDTLKGMEELARVLLQARQALEEAAKNAKEKQEVANEK